MGWNRKIRFSRASSSIWLTAFQDSGDAETLYEAS
jgi:hypothetical protein